MLVEAKTVSVALYLLVSKATPVSEDSEVNG